MSDELIPVYVDGYPYSVRMNWIETIFPLNNYEYGIEFRVGFSITDDSEVRIAYEEVKRIIKINRDLVDYRILTAYDWEENYEENVRNMFDNWE